MYTNSSVPGADTRPSTTVVFIENDIAGYQQLAAAMGDGAEVHILDASLDGLAEIARLLGGRGDVGAVHIVSHGASGLLQLGTTQLTASSLAGHEDALELIKSSLVPGADLLLYGCDAGAGPEGAALLDALSAATGADVAASDNPTGAAALGGDWVLERSVGNVQSRALSAPGFAGLLTVPGNLTFDPDDGLPHQNSWQYGDFIFRATSASPLWFGTNPGDAIGMTVGSGNVLEVNYVDSPGIYGFEIQSSSLANNFKLLSMAIAYLGSDNNTDSTAIWVYGYEGGSSGTVVASGVFNLLSSSTGASFSYTIPGSAYQAGTLTFGAAWQSVDTIRFQAAGGMGLHVGIDDIMVTAPEPIQSATYDAATGALVVTAYNLAAGSIVSSNSLMISGEGGNAVRLSSGDFSATANGFTVTLNATDKQVVNSLLNKNGSSSAGGSTFNLLADANWSPGATGDYTTPVTVSNVTAPAITSAAYLAASGQLVVTGANLVLKLGSANDITVSKLTITGEGGATYTLTTANVEVTSATGFTVNLSQADRNALDLILNKNGTSSTSGTTYNLAAADDWNTIITGGDISDSSSPVTVTDVAVPAIASASYDVTTGALRVTGSGFSKYAGAANDIVPTCFTITGDGGASYTLTSATPGVEVTSGTTFTLTLGTADRNALKSILDNNGTASLSGDAFTLTASDGWLPGSGPGHADTSGDQVTVTGIVRPAVTHIAFGDQSLAANQATTVTFSFSQPVSGFTEADVTVKNGTISPPVTSDGGLTYTATLTPAAGVEATDNNITVHLSGIVNANGYAGLGAYISDYFSVDTIAPAAATITLQDALVKAGQTTQVSFHFSEPMTHGFALDHLTVENGTLGPLTSADGGNTWIATFTPSTGVSDTTNAISLDMTGVQDAAGNTGSGTVSSNNYSVQTVRPTASVVVDDASLTVGESTLVTITFSEPVTGFNSSDLTIEGGSLGTLSSADGGQTWTAIFTPDTESTAAARFIRLDNTGFTNAAGNTGTGVTSSNSYAIDTARPTATIVLADPDLAVGESSLVTITFSEPVTGFSNLDLTVESGTLGPVSSADGGRTWTATFSPFPGVTDLSNVITLDNTGVADAAGNAGTGTTTSLNYTIDSEKPTATIVISDPDLHAGEAATVTITFSEAVTGFSNADLSVENGTLGAMSSGDGGITWTATFTPDANVTDTTNAIILDNTGVADLAGNAGAGTTSSANYMVQTVRPTASIVVADTQLVAGETSLVTITFSEAVVGLTAADFTVGNGTLSAPSSSDGGITWTATLTPTPNATGGSNAVILNNGGYMNATGNTGTGTTSSNGYAVDTQRPTASIAISDTNLKAGDAALVTITFSEAVTGFTTASLSAANGTISGLATADNITYTATLNPATNTTAATNFISFDNSFVTDGAGNAGTGTTTSSSYAVDTIAPTATIAMSDTALLAGEHSTVTVSFSEAVTGVTADDFTLSNGSLGALASSDGGRTWSAVFTPDVNVSAASNAIAFAPSGITDFAGNAGSGSPISVTYSVQTVRPTATISIDKVSLSTGSSATVIIAFSEAVTGLEIADFSVPNGTLQDLVSGDGGITWTATLTPRSGVSDTTNVLSLALAGVTNAAGNAGTGSAVSANYAVSTGGGGSGGAGTPATIDGVPATIVTGTDPRTGLAVEVLTVRPIAPNRADDPSSPNAGLADIPLGVKASDGASIGLTVSLPVGAGLTASGPASALTHASALADLLQRIDDAANGTAAANDIAAKGTAFLDSLAPGTLVETKTLAFSGGAGGTLQPLHVTGTAPQQGGAVALVIDTTSLPAGATIELDHVEFAAVVGTATLRGGDGRQFVTADDAAQNIYLGADDDELHAGGGDDVVGSGGGNDLVDGGAGNDLVYGGTGNDIVEGGAGNDVVLGGRSDAGQWQFFVDAHGTVTARHENAAVAPGSWEDVAAGELDANAAGLAFLSAGGAQLQQLALLYDAAFGRAADLQGLSFWAAHAGTASDTMAHFMQQAEYDASKYAGLGDEAFVRAVYSNVLGREADSGGLAFWTAKLQDGGTLARSDILAGFALSAEHAAHMTTDGKLALAAATNAGQAQWFAGSGDDRLEGGAGNDVLVGGDGTDTVVFHGARSSYRLTLAQDGSIRISDTATGDVDTLYGIERGEFADGTADLGFTQANAHALQNLGLLYHTVLGRTADIGGMNFWLTQDGDALSMAQRIVATGEFQSRYAGADDAAFANALFTNTGLQASQAGGIGYWTEYAHSHSRAETVAAWITNTDVIGAQFGPDGLWLV